LLEHSPSGYHGNVEVVAVSLAATAAKLDSAAVSNNDESSTLRLDMGACLQVLKQRQINTVLCEGGARLAGSILDADLVDEVYWFIAPKILADSQALPAVSSGWARLIGQTPNLRVKDHKLFSQDVLIHALRPIN
jgi:diaminohydroxyphosphoribosylaminopyrimidine deaminase/5-amino-6-(5-phosphoribosylamino)uracil reductase